MTDGRKRRRDRDARRVALGNHDIVNHQSCLIEHDGSRITHGIETPHFAREFEYCDRLIVDRSRNPSDSIFLVARHAQAKRHSNRADQRRPAQVRQNRELRGGTCLCCRVRFRSSDNCQALITSPRNSVAAATRPAAGREQPQRVTRDRDIGLDRDGLQRRPSRPKGLGLTHVDNVHMQFPVDDLRAQELVPAGPEQLGLAVVEVLGAEHEHVAGRLLNRDDRGVRSLCCRG